MIPLAVDTGAGNGYVAAAYAVLIALILSYVVIMAVKLARIEREVAELSAAIGAREAGAAAAPDPDAQAATAAQERVAAEESARR